MIYEPTDNRTDRYFLMYLSDWVASEMLGYGVNEYRDASRVYFTGCGDSEMDIKDVLLIKDLSRQLLSNATTEKS